MKNSNVLAQSFLGESTDAHPNNKPQHCATLIQVNLCSLIKVGFSFKPYNYEMIYDPSTRHLYDPIVL